MPDNINAQKQHKHTNRLIDETSPYLLQHAHNPVDWYAWGEEALEKAKREDKPILLSVGYSACHWCHVMERESFENEEIAGLMNQHFVSIKVDREERPDIDNIYMQAVQALTQQGGWRVTVNTGERPCLAFLASCSPSLITTRTIAKRWRSRQTSLPITSSSAVVP